MQSGMRRRIAVLLQRKQSVALSRRDQAIVRLDEQGASKERIGTYPRRWLGRAGTGTMVIWMGLILTGCVSTERNLERSARTVCEKNEVSLVWSELAKVAEMHDEMGNSVGEWVSENMALTKAGTLWLTVVVNGVKGIRVVNGKPEPELVQVWRGKVKMVGEKGKRYLIGAEITPGERARVIVKDFGDAGKRCFIQKNGG